MRNLDVNHLHCHELARLRIDLAVPIIVLINLRVVLITDLHVVVALTILRAVLAIMCVVLAILAA